MRYCAIISKPALRRGVVAGLLVYCAEARGRTWGRLGNSEALYQLSYVGRMVVATTHPRLLAGVYEQGVGVGWRRRLRGWGEGRQLETAP